jgi:hypothetical protein
MTRQDIARHIENRVRRELPSLPPQERKWAEDHRTQPREIAAVDEAGGKSIAVWLVTDNTGRDDASYRVVYDATRDAFGLVMTDDAGVDRYLGAFGSLLATVEAI